MILPSTRITNNTGELGYDVSMGPGKLVRHMQNLSYKYDEYLICIGLGSSISSVICKNLSYSGPSYPSSPVSLPGAERQGLSCLCVQRVIWTPRTLFFDSLNTHKFMSEFADDDSSEKIDVEAVVSLFYKTHKAVTGLKKQNL